MSTTSIKELQRRKVLKAKCLNSFEFFLRYMYKKKEKEPFILNWHHEKICKFLQEYVCTGKVTRSVVNMPPRYSKTLVISIYFMAWCFAKNPRCKFIHLSYEKKLALGNSKKVKDLILSDAFQELFSEVQISKDTKSKSEWNTTQDGGVYATSSESGVTGFGAGSLEDRPGGVFSGCIIIDDPNKIQKCIGMVQQVKKYCENINDTFEEVVLSRCNGGINTPILVVQQRIVQNDLSGYLLSNQSVDKWFHINLPVINKHDGKPLWPMKHTMEDIERERNGVKSGRKFNGQLMQNPQPSDKDIMISPRYFEERYSVLPLFEKIVISADTAQKDKDINDPTCFLVLGLRQKRWYLIEAVVGRMKYPVLKEKAKTLCLKYNPSELIVEDKSSGSSLVQEFREDKDIRTPVYAMQTGNQNKVQRMDEGTDQLEAGFIVLPSATKENVNWLKDLEDEWFTFPNSTNFDRVDALSQFLKRLRGKNDMFIY